jgi:hypothetical protein
MPVVPDTQEAEQQGHLSLNSRPAWATQGDSHLKTKRQKNYNKTKLGIVVYCCNPSTEEFEAGEPQVSRPIWAT